MAMAAANIPGLQVTAPDEDMEISSDYERIGDEIDIDIDLTVDPSHHEDEDYMLEDARSERGQEADNKDDIMLDGDGDGNYDEDGIMQDDGSVPDEHLTDASEMGYVDVDVKEALHVQDVEVQDRGQGDDYIGYDDEVVDVQPDDHLQTTTQQPDVLPVPDEGAEIAETAPSQSQDEARDEIERQEPSSMANPPVGDEKPVEEHQDTKSLAQSSAEPAAVQPTEGTNGQDQIEDVVPAASNARPVEPEKDVPEEQEAQKAGEGQVQETSEPQQGPELPPEPTETVVDFSQLPFDDHSETDASSDSIPPMHPVIVVYHGEEISLFPPTGGDTSETFFLQDHSLAHHSIQEMLRACRQVLGDTIRDEDELEIDIAELGLRVSEDSADAANTSFTQVLDVYVQLYHLDGVSPDSLYVTLNTKTRFSSRLNALIQAVTDSRGFSQIPFLNEDVEVDTYPEAESVHREQTQGDASQEQHQTPTGSASVEHISVHDDVPQEEQDRYPEGVERSEGQASAADAESITAPAQGVASAEDQHAVDVSQSQEVSSVHKFTEASYPPEPSVLPSADGPLESEPSQHLEDGNEEHTGQPTTPTAVSLPDSSPEDDLIDYDDGQNGEEAKDDSSNGSSTVKGDTTPAGVDNTSQADQPSAVEETAQIPSSITALPQDETPVAEDQPAAEGPEYTEESYVEEAAVSIDDNASQVGEEYPSEEHIAEQLGNSNNEPEYQGDGQGESFDLPPDEDEYPDDEQTLNFPDGDEAEYEQEEGDYVETEDYEEREEKLDVAAHEAKDAESPYSTNADAFGDDHTDHFQDGVYDDADAEKFAENVFDEATSALNNNMQPSGDEHHEDAADEEDDLDTIDYDDEELSEPATPVVDEKPLASREMAPSPSSAKRGRDEDAGDDDAGNTQALKKVKSQ